MFFSCHRYASLSCLILSSLGMNGRQMMAELHRASGEIDLKSPFVKKGAPKRSSRLDLGTAVQSQWNNPSVVMFLFLYVLINKCSCSVWHCMLCSGGYVVTDSDSVRVPELLPRLMNPDLHVLTCKKRSVIKKVPKVSWSQCKTSSKCELNRFKNSKTKPMSGACVLHKVIIGACSGWLDIRSKIHVLNSSTAR